MPPTRRAQKGKENSENLQKKRGKNKRKMFQYAPEQLETALEEIKEKRMGVREASRQFNIPKTTIIDRLKGRVLVARRKTGPDPILTIEVEKKIVEWIIKIAKCGFPLKKSDLLNTVQKIARETDKAKFFKDGRPGQKWYKQFMKRHPELSLREAEGINKARAVITEEYIRSWFRELQIFLTEKNLNELLDDSSRVFNGDESGFSLCPKSGKVLGPKGWQNLYQIKLGNEKENLTVLIVFSADGVICPPLVVFPYIRPPRAVIDSMPPHWVLGRSESGWMRSDVFFEYIANDFNKWLTEKQIKRPIILFIDGHKSHMTLALSEFCDSNEIILYALPANTTHILQPADVSVFRPLKNEWKKTVRSWQNRPENSNMCVSKLNFCQVFNETLCNNNMTEQIINGFRKCGLYPLNPDNVDYTKCVKNFQETLAIQNNDDKAISFDEWTAAKKVIRKIAPALKEYGISANVILNEINEGANISSLTSKQSLLQVGEIVLLQDLTIVPYENIILEVDVTQPSSTALESIAQGSNEKPPNDPQFVCKTSVENTKQINAPQEYGGGSSNLICEDQNEDSPDDPEFIRVITSKKDEQINTPLESGNIKSSLINGDLSNELEFDRVTNEKNEEIYAPLESGETNSGLISGNTKANPDLCLEANKSQTSSPISERCSLQSILHKHLVLPQPIEPTGKNKRIKDNFPSAISSMAWRMKLATKEEEKANKEEETKRKRQEKQAQVKDRQKKNANKKKEKPVKQIERDKENETIRKENLQCSACEEDLISDVEDEDEKNIGCDKCSRWFHMKCTEFIGMSYEEAASQDYLCFMCS